MKKCISRSNKAVPLSYKVFMDKGKIRKQFFRNHQEKKLNKIEYKKLQKKISTFLLCFSDFEEIVYSFAFFHEQPV